MTKSLSALIVAASLLLSACGDGGSDEVAEPQGDSQSSTVASPEAPSLAFGDTVAELPDDFSYEDGRNSVSGDVDYFVAEVDTVPVLYTPDGVPVPAPEGLEAKEWYVNDEGVFLFASRTGSGLTSAEDVFMKIDPASGAIAWEVPPVETFELRNPDLVVVFQKTLVVSGQFGGFRGVDVKTGKQTYQKSFDVAEQAGRLVKGPDCLAVHVDYERDSFGGRVGEIYETFDPVTGGSCATPFDPDAIVVMDGTYSSQYLPERANDPEALEFYDNGKRIWSIPGVEASYLGRNSEEVVVTNKENGVLAALALSDGKELAQVTVGCPEGISGKVLNDDRMILNCKVSDDSTTYSIIAI